MFSPTRSALAQRTSLRLAEALRRFEGSWADDLVRELKSLKAGEWTVIFGAELLWSVLPLLIILASLANHRIDGDLSRHIGLDSQGAHIVGSLFRNSPRHSPVAIATGIIFAMAGTLAVINSMQLLYERAGHLDARGWRDAPRFLLWLVVLLAVLVLQGIVTKPISGASGPVVEALERLVVATIFFWFTMHFLLAGRAPWRALFLPAFATALLWLGLALFSSVFFSSSVVTDSREYGTIGVVFTFLTWFIAVGAVIVLGAASGAVWHRRRDRDTSGTAPDAASAATSRPAG